MAGQGYNPAARAAAGTPVVRQKVSAPVAQLDRALASGAKGQRFESSRARHTLKGPVRGPFLYGAVERCGSNLPVRPADEVGAERRRIAATAPQGCASLASESSSRARHTLKGPVRGPFLYGAVERCGSNLPVRPADEAGAARRLPRRSEPPGWREPIVDAAPAQNRTILRRISATHFLRRSGEPAHRARMDSMSSLRHRGKSPHRAVFQHCRHRR
jgi:hypothetical protein